MSNMYDATSQQVRAWMYYGFWTSQSRREKVDVQPSGEVRYVVGWASEQLSRMRWNLRINGSTEWSLSINGETIRSRSDEQDADDDESLAAASAEVLEKAIGWRQSTTREVATNLYVGGELDYLAIPDQSDANKFDWHVVSVVHPKRKDLIDAAKFRVRGLWPHPADPSQPDAPIFGVLSILDQLDWLAKVSNSQSANRASLRGFLAIVDALSVANGGDFWKEINKSLSAKMKDPTDTAPVVLRGSKELIAADGQGIAGMQWLIPQFPYNDRIDTQIDKLIQRLAYGLPIPPEILLGFSAQSRAVAFQVEENSYRAHIEPPALLIARIQQKALSKLLPEGTEVEVVPDPAELLARRNSVADVQWAWEHGLVSAEYTRDVIDIPETSAATPEDIELLLLLKDGAEPGAPDPANVAAEEGRQSLSALVASVGGPNDPPLDPDALLNLSEFLSDLDHSLMSELAGATASAVDRAREKVGANARSRDSLRASLPRSVPNAGVAAEVKMEKLLAAGVPIEEIVRDSLAGLADWWRVRVTEAQQVIRFVIGEDAAPDFTTTMVEDSVDLLMQLMIEHITDTLESETSQPLPSADTIRVLSVAGGTHVRT